jgi:hypothetical protein
MIFADIEKMWLVALRERGGYTSAGAYYFGKRGREFATCK